MNRRLCNLTASSHAPEPARLYPCGWRCDLHAPWALAGQPCPEPGPGWPAGAWTVLTPISHTVIDQRAIATGKRRSTQHAYRAAQAAITHTRSTP